jgi:hypothetical protein
MISKIDPKKCRYLEDKDLPKLVLALHDNYRTNSSRQWRYIAHQTAGHACHQHYMKAIILKPKKQVMVAMKEIDKHWLDSDAGMVGYPTLDELLKYRKQLKNLLDVDCNISYDKFEEGIYPIDCTGENLKKLCTDKLPKSLDDLVKFRAKIDWLFCCIGRWNLYILGNNCD